MEVITVENCFLKNKSEEVPITVKFAGEGIAIKPRDDDVIVIKKDDIKNIEMFRGNRGLCLRIYEKSLHSLGNIHENHIESLKSFCLEWYKVNIYLKELEIDNVNFGELDVNGQNFLEFRNEKTIFDIPIKDIDSVADIRNEISIRFDNVEIRFVTDKDSIKEIKDACNSNIEDSIITFEGLTVVYPRGKNNILLYKDYFRIIGYSYDHKIYYRNIKEIFDLEKNYIDDKDRYIVLGLDSPIRQGQTKYGNVVFSFSDEEVDIDVSDERLESRYCGLFSKVFLEIFEIFCVTKAIKSTFLASNNSRCLKCISKAYEGQLYPLDHCLLFLPRSLRINLKDIYSVEFSRINVSLMQAKTFDMTIFTESQYTFNCIPKEDFGALEKYFNDKKVVIRSEVIDEVISSDESDDTSDDFIVSDEEE